MADTWAIRRLIEPHVLSWLSQKYGQPFKEQPLLLITGKAHRVDGVSADRTIAANILSNRSVTRGAKTNTGGIRKAETDFWKLANIKDRGLQLRLMVFTDTSFMEKVRRTIGDPSLAGVDFVCCPLPPKLQRQLDEILDEASKEQRSGADRRDK